MSFTQLENHSQLLCGRDVANERLLPCQTSWEEQQQQTRVGHAKEPSSLEKRMGCRVMGQWLQVLEEVPERGQHHARVADPWVVHRRESE